MESTARSNVSFDLHNRIKNFKIVQFFKFCIVGCSNFLVSFTVFYLVFNYGRLSQWFPLIQNFDGGFANVCGYTAGVINSFIWNRTWTFKVTHNKHVVSEAKKFIVVNTACAAFSTLGIFIFVDMLQYPYKLTWLLVGGVTAVLNFSGYKFWVFHKQDKGHDGNKI